LAVGNCVEALAPDDAEVLVFDVAVVFVFDVLEATERRGGVGVATGTGWPGVDTSELTGAFAEGGGDSSSSPNICR
jgi:hypothetical protein